jgi:mono/diheme cytochrome c family protein
MNKTALLVGVLLTLVACREEPVVEPEPLTEVQSYMANAEAMSRASALFAGSCADTCHALEPVETTEASYLFDCAWNHGSSDEEIARTIRVGISGTRMVGFGSNFPEGDADLWKIVAWLRSKQVGCDTVE